MAARGRTLRLSRPRRWIGDLMHFSRQVPAVTFERRMGLAALAAARASLPDRPAWPLLFMRAFAAVSARRPELRRVFVPFPRPRLYEHPEPVAVMAVERDVGGEPAVLFAPFRSPHERPLPQLTADLRRYKTAPIGGVKEYRRLWRVSGYPGFLRRPLWWFGLNTSGKRRVKHVGTFGVSVTAGLGSAALGLLSPSAFSLHYGPFDEHWRLDVRVTFDHRVIDGAPVARAMADLEQTLRQVDFCETLHVSDRKPHLP